MCGFFYGFLMFHHVEAFSSSFSRATVQACVIARELPLTDVLRANIARCLGWQENNAAFCAGAYQPIVVSPLADSEQIQIKADQVSFYQDKPSTLSGHVSIQQEQRIVSAQTAYIYRDPKTNKIQKIEFIDNVRFIEPDRLMIARKATVHPEDKSGIVEDALYRFNVDRKRAVLPAWGRASLIQRFANKNYLLRQVTYTTCAPQDKAWDIQAESIAMDNVKGRVVARNAKLRINQHPIIYSPYLSFSTNTERKSGFLTPIIGYSNIGGLSLGMPYYLNLAPNYDMTVTPQLYSERGVLLGGEYRFLTPNSSGVVIGSFLPQDRAYRTFLQDNELLYPQLRGDSTNRWSFGILENTKFTPNLQLNVNAYQVSDDYYPQDFSSNLAMITQRQLLRQADLVYTTDHWLFRGMGQSYLTLHPINETPISDVYERLPQLMAKGYYSELPFNANFNVLGQYDQFHWPTSRGGLFPVEQVYGSVASTQPPQGPRFHLNPIFSLPQVKPWGFLTPSVQVVENYYEVQDRWGLPNAEINRFIPRYSIDSGLFFERDFNIRGRGYTQTLEPRLFYLNVPYQNQSAIPIYDSGNMIFNADQLFRTNRFSGFDRIGDANQLAYALTTRWLFEETGAERASLSVGQIKYFANRQVQLCQSLTGYCEPDPNAFGQLSPDSKTSPIASRGVYHFNPIWALTSDYVWDPATNATNNGNLNIHYQPAPNQLATLGYTYLVNGDMTQVRQQGTADNALHQASFALGWPLRDKWSVIGAYNHNISKNYSMMSLLGLQYDTCCWAIRAFGGRTFQSLNANFEPQYNNNVYLQILLKGLGSVANSDPSTILSTYLPGYNDPFHH